MNAAIPVIEIALNADAARAGRPNGKVGAANAFRCDQVRPEFLVRIVVAALAHEVKVEFSEYARKSIGIVKFKGFAVACADLNFVTRGRRRSSLVLWQNGFEKAFRTQFHGFDNDRR